MWPYTTWYCDFTNVLISWHCCFCVGELLLISLSLCVYMCVCVLVAKPVGPTVHICSWVKSLLVVHGRGACGAGYYIRGTSPSMQVCSPNLPKLGTRHRENFESSTPDCSGVLLIKIRLSPPNMHLVLPPGCVRASTWLRLVVCPHYSYL